MFEACGKFILSGEHFILYGIPALALPLSTAKLRLLPQSFTALPSQNDTLASTSKQAVEHIWGEACRRLKVEVSRFPYEVESSLPMGCGLGSSAALCVAILRALNAVHALYMSEEQLCVHATALESFFHGRSSGLDPRVIVMEQPLCFAMNASPRVWKWERNDVVILLAVSRDQRQTSVAVEKVRQFSVSSPVRFSAMKAEMEKRIAQIQRVCTVPALPAETLGQAMSHNHELLAEMGVSSSHLQHLVRAAKKAGSLGAKLTGAGMGGAMIAVADRDCAHQVQKALLAAEARVCFVLDPNF
ncbi:MAG: mevalonate kinase [Myxococcota bacterium]